MFGSRRRRFFRFSLRLVFFLSCRVRLFPLLLCRRFLRGSFLPFAPDERDFVSNVHLPAFLHVNVGERSVLGRFPLHGRFVCLNLGEHFTSRDLIALLFLPRYEGSLTHRVAQFRHLDLRHGSKGYNVTGVISLQWQFLFVMVVTPLTNFTRSRPVSQR